MNTILNEYVHESYKIVLPNGKYKVFYEPLDCYAIYLNGTIYKGSNLIESFTITDHGLSFMAIQRSVVSGVVRGFFFDNKLIVLIWNKDPGEHFLCVSYDCCDVNPFFLNNKEWSREGF